MKPVLDISFYNQETGAFDVAGAFAKFNKWEDTRDLWFYAGDVKGETYSFTVVSFTNGAYVGKLHKTPLDIVLKYALLGKEHDRSGVLLEQ